MTPKQQRFVDEYLIDLNATQAAIRAGYSAKTANEQGARLLTNVSVRSAIAAAQQERAKRTHITQDRVLQEIARIAFSDVRALYNEDGSLKKPGELTDEAAAALASVEVMEIGGDDAPLTLTKKTKVFDKVAALTLAARHLGMLNDKLKLGGDLAIKVSLVPRKP